MFVAQGVDLSSVHGRVIALVDFVGWEIGDVNVGAESGLKGCADVAELIPDDSVEEGVVTDIGASELAGGGTETIGDVAKETL